MAAEEAGFDFVAISDHFHPWLYDHGHSAFAWSVLAAIAARTERIGLATGVTCPSIRYHPAIVAQAAATTAACPTGASCSAWARASSSTSTSSAGRPAVTERHELFREALEIIRSLWSGGYQSYEGKHLKLEDARIFDLPESPIPIAVAIGGPRGARIAAELGDAIFSTDPDPGLVDAYERAGGSGRSTPRSRSPGPRRPRTPHGRPTRCSGSGS